MKKVTKYIFLTLAWIISIIVLILLLASLLIQTQPVKKRLANFSEQQVEKVLKGEFSLGKIGGNFFTGLVLEDVLLTYENDTIAYIDKFTVNYNLWSLADGDLNIGSAEIQRPYFFLEQYNDSTWNVQTLVKTEPGAPDTTRSGTFEINLSDISIVDGTIKTSTPDTIIPQRIENWNTEFSLFLGNNKQNATIDEFSFSTVRPDFTLEELTLELEKDSDFIKLTDFYLKTTQNQLEGEIEYAPAPNREGSLDLKTTELQLNEFEYFIPSLKLPATPIVEIDAQMEGESVVVNLLLQENDQRINLDVSSSNLAEFLFGEKKPRLVYQLDGTLENVELGHWMGNPKIDYLLNGQISANGRGTDPKDAFIEVNANLNETVIENKRLTELIADLRLNHGNLDGVVRGAGEFGRFSVSPNIRNLFDYPVYRAELTTQNLNLAQLMGNDSLSSNLNLIARVNGRGFEPDQLSASTEIVFSDSRFREIQIDTLVADAGFQNENIQIDSLWLQTDTVTLNASGNYNLSGPSDLRVSAEFGGLEEFRSYIPVDSLKTSGNFDAHLQGTTDSMDLSANLHLNETEYNDIVVKSFDLDADAAINSQDTTFDARGMAHQLVAGEYKIDSLQFDIEGSADSMYLVASAASNEINTDIETGITPGDVLRLTIFDWQIEYKDRQWSLQQPPAVVEIDSLTYKIDNFKLASDLIDSAHYVTLQGKITRKGEEDFQIKLANLDIETLNDFLDLDTEASGTLDLNMNLQGTATAPEITGNYTLENAAFNGYNFTTFNGGIDYDQGQLKFNTLIVPQDSGKLDVMASLPLVISPDTMGFHFNPQDSIDGKLTVERFPLAILQALDITGNIEGYIQGDVTLDGTAESPQTEGNLSLQNASAEIEEYGIHYRDVKLNLTFDNRNVILDTLKIRSDDGTLTGNGKINFQSDFYKGEVSQSQINLNFDKFNVVDHDQFNLQVTGHANLGGEKGNVVYGGDLKIPQAEIYLPAVLGMMGKMTAPEIAKPILVREVERMDVSIDSIDIKTFSPPKPDSVQFTYLDDLEGQLRIRIPRNMWIKNEDMRIEISGELELRKNQEFFELFGSVEVVRGQYDLLGKTFNITDGAITFQGGEELLPRIDITATYTFRSAQKAQRNLTVQVSGTAESPEVDFFLDGSSISEGDALSYILFGKGMNELTLSEQENVAGGGNLAEKAAASVLSSQLSSFLGSKLNVDYIEVKSQGSFNNASVVVGKYITNDLFVSYEQRFGEVDEKDVAKYEVKLEYELFRFLFFELNNSSNDSGFDVIVKFDVK